MLRMGGMKLYASHRCGGGDQTFELIHASQGGVTATINLKIPCFASPQGFKDKPSPAGSFAPQIPQMQTQAMYIMLVP